MTFSLFPSASVLNCVKSALACSLSLIVEPFSSCTLAKLPVDVDTTKPSSIAVFTCAWTPVAAPGRFTVTLPLTKLSRTERPWEGFCCWLKRAAGRKSSPTTTTTSTRRKRSYLTVGLQRGFLHPAYISSDVPSYHKVTPMRPYPERS